MNILLPILKKADLEPVLFFPENLHVRKIGAYQPDLQDFSFWERGVLNQTIIPFLDRNPAPDPEAVTCLTPKQLCKKFNANACYGYAPIKVPNINAPSFVQMMDKLDPFMTISIRCLQIAHNPLIETLTKPIPGTNAHREFINVHPAVLPYIRGLLGPAWSYAYGQKLGCTVHKIDRGVDTGNHLYTQDTAFIPGRTIFESMTDLPLMMKQVLRHAIVDAQAPFGLPEGYPQQKDSSGRNYHSYPNPFAANELAYRIEQELPSLKIDEYSKTPHAEREALRIKIKKAEKKVKQVENEVRDWHVWKEATNRNRNPLVLVDPEKDKNILTSLFTSEVSEDGRMHAQILSTIVDEAQANFAHKPIPADALPPEHIREYVSIRQSHSHPRRPYPVVRARA
jgi:methionyl-tRNA formyltransferase